MLKQIYKLGKLEIYKTYKENQLQEHRLIDLFWECTLTCNAKCKHCGSSAEKRKYEGELTTEEIKNALNIFKTKTLSQLCERVFIILFLMGVCLKIKNRVFFNFNSNFLSNFNFFYIFINFHL